MSNVTDRTKDREFAISEIRAIVNEYSEIKNRAGLSEIQDIRDRLEITKNLHASDLEANARNAMDVAEITRKRKEATLKIEYCQDVGKGKRFSTKEDAKEMAFLDSSSEYDLEIEAKHFYYLVKEMRENIEKFHLTVGSRVRMLHGENN
jgi:hypothetical protein